LQVPLERAESRCPLRSIRLEPRVELHQRFGTEPVEPSLSIPADLDQPGIAQHLEVTRHAWLMHPDRLDQLADGPLTLAHGIKDSPPGRFSDRLEDCDLWRHGKRAYARTYICATICMSFTTGRAACPEPAYDVAILGTNSRRHERADAAASPRPNRRSAVTLIRVNVHVA